MQPGIKRGFGTDVPIKTQDLEMMGLTDSALEHIIERVRRVHSVREGENVQQTLAGSIDPVGRDDISGKRGTVVQRIQDLNYRPVSVYRLREIALALQGRGKRQPSERSGRSARQIFLGPEEKQFFPALQQPGNQHRSSDVVARVIVTVKRSWEPITISE